MDELGVEKFLHGQANGMRGQMINSIGSASVRQFGLKPLGLVPPGHMEDIVRGAIGLATEGFFEGVSAGRIVVHPNRTITRLLADGGQPATELDDGTRLRADLIICATGFTQGVPFLPADVKRQVLDERGNQVVTKLMPVGGHHARLARLDACLGHRTQGDEFMMKVRDDHAVASSRFHSRSGHCRAGPRHAEQPQAVVMAPGRELAQVQRAGLAGHAGVPGQEPG